MTPQELFVFWIEYVIRYRGAPQLRPPVTRLSMVELLLVDVGALVVGLVITFLLLVRCSLKLFSVACCRKVKMD